MLFPPHQASALVSKGLLPGAVPSEGWVRMNVARAPTRASSNCIMQPESLLQLSRQAMPQTPQGSLPTPVPFSPPEDWRWFLSSYSSLEGAKDFISHPGGVEGAGLCPQKPSPQGGALEPCSGVQGGGVIDTLLHSSSGWGHRPS